MTIDGVERPPLLTDSTRWRRVLFDAPGWMQMQRMNDAASTFIPTIDTVGHTIAIKRGVAITASAGRVRPDSTERAEIFTYSRPERTHLVIDGPLDGHVLHLELTDRDPSSFLLRSRGFHWVQERPFNR